MALASRTVAGVDTLNPYDSRTRVVLPATTGLSHRRSAERGEVDILIGCTFQYWLGHAPCECGTALKLKHCCSHSAQRCCLPSCNGEARTGYSGSLVHWPGRKSRLHLHLGPMLPSFARQP